MKAKSGHYELQSSGHPGGRRHRPASRLAGVVVAALALAVTGALGPAFATNGEDPFSEGDFATSFTQLCDANVIVLCDDRAGHPGIQSC